MSYNEVLSFLYGQLPMYQRIGAAAYKENLDNTIAIANILGNPERKFISVHIAGTNGKGSVSHALASVLQAAGYKTGLYTSPHLLDFRERIRINGSMISKEKLVDFVNSYQSIFTDIKPSFFEWSVGLAFHHFAEEQVDIAVIETGMGGRLDSTNIVSPLVSVITNISLDHTQFLGNSIAEIAREKAGIIKSKAPVVIGESNELTSEIFEEIAHSKESPITYADKAYRIDDVVANEEDIIFSLYKKDEVVYRNLKTDLTGIYQRKNIVSLFAVTEILNASGFSLSETAIRNGLENVKKNTGLAGRWQKIMARPAVYCDTAHNESGLREVLSQIELTGHQQLHFVLGVVSDKNMQNLATLFPKNASYYFTQPSIPRGMDVNKLKDIFAATGIIGSQHSDVSSAYITALRKASPDDLIFVGGSTFVVADLLAYLNSDSGDADNAN